MLVDLHAHYPMHVVPDGSTDELLRTWPAHRIRARIVDLVSRLANYEGPRGEPGVTVPLLREGDVGVALSVLFNPWTELEPGSRYDDPPRDAYFRLLLEVLDAVEAEVATHAEAQIVRSGPELDRCLAEGRIALIHAVEGAVQLGGPAVVAGNVEELARRGVAYVTIAHLFWRQVATVAPALPFLPDRVYRLLFRQPGDEGLGACGRAAVTAMVRHGVLVDVTHMSDASFAETFALLDELDPARRLPVLASHMACRFGHLAYAMTDDQIRRVADRGGVLGVIAGRHHVTDGLRRRGRNPSWEDTTELVFAHVERIAEVTGSWDHAAIGSDLDGYIKPALTGLGHAGRMGALQEALRTRYGAQPPSRSRAPTRCGSSGRASADARRPPSMRTCVRIMEYVELHAHSAFSFLDGASLPDELAQRAAELGYGTFALTDHDGLYGSMEFAQAAAATGVRAIHGAEVTIRDRADDPHPARHLTLLVRDERGWSNLCRLLTRAHAHTRDSARRVRTEPELLLADVEEFAEGLVCLSGCAMRGVRDEPTMRRLLHAFGPESFRVELQRPMLAHDRARNRGLASLARRLGVPAVATGNVHAHARVRALLQDAFVAVRSGQTLDASEPLRRGNHSHVLTSPRAMASRFADHPDAVAETVRLAETLRFDLRSDLGYRYPGAEDEGAPRELAAVCRHRLDERYPPGSPRRDEALARLDEELRIIERLGLAGFFLLHRDLLELAREVAVEVRGPDSVRAVLPPGRGRGSSVSSIVCYLTGLSHVDPLVAELGLGRFLNDDLQSLPDIDLDFPRDIRAVLIPRVHERYGREHSALVAAFPTYRARGAIRDLGKALGLPPGEIERVARGSEGWSSRTVDQDIATALGRTVHKDGGDRASPASRWDWLARLADEAYGLPRHLSQHSGGMIVATRPLVDCVPLVPAAMEGRQMAHWDKDSCADAGFLKIDLLGLGMLSCVERCVELIHDRRHERIDLSRVPLDDPDTYDAITTADTTGVFQIESRAQMASLLRTRPRSLEELTIQVAIVRPGPIVGGAVNPYIERLQRLRADPTFQVPYLHDALRGPLAETLGTIIFQDQVIEVAQAFAGFTAGQAESLRRAMSRKRSEAAIEAHHRAFVEGAQRTHPDVTEAQAEAVFAMVAGFSGFGFPKAHAAAFGLLAYQSTWLRVHYGPEFLCSLLDEQPMGFYPPDALVHEAQRRGIDVLAPEINASAVGCTVTEDGAVQIGLGYVLGVRSEQVEALVAEREASGPYRSLEDLASRAGAGRAALEQLAWSGACDALAGGDRRAALWRLGVAAPGVDLSRRGEGTQLSLPLDVGAAPALPQLGRWEAMLADYATTGLTAAAHPLALLRDGLTARGAVTAAQLRGVRHGERVVVGGLTVARQRPGTAAGIVFLLLEDETGTINLVVRPEVYERDRLAIRTEPLLVAEGVLERHPAAAGGINVLVSRVRALEAPVERPRAEVTDFHPFDDTERERRAAAAGDFRAVAPPVMSFAQGRRR